MASDFPITFQENLQLTDLGIPQDAITFNTCTLESDRYICVRDKNDQGAAQVVIIDLHNNNSVVRRNISADSAIMHPSDPIIALRAQGKTLQVFNLDTKQKLGSYTMPEDVVFWKWIDTKSLALVTQSSIFHWDVVSGASAPAKLTDRHPSLADSQIINYRVNAAGTWSVLVGIASEQGRIVGHMQLYSKARGISQAIEGHAAAFAEFRMDGASSDSHLFTFAVRNATSTKLHIIEVDHEEGNPVYPKKQVDIFFPPEASGDFPVGLQVSKRYGIIYVITKYGFVHLYDIDTAVCIYMNRISSDTIFTTTDYDATSGILGINRKGQVLSFSVNDETIIPYILNNLSNTSLAVALASRAGLPGADDLYVQQFQSLLSSGNYTEAAKVAATSPRGVLRTTKTIEQLKHLGALPGQPSPIIQYFSFLLDRGSLNTTESLELAKPVLQQNRKELLEKWIAEDKLEASEELGDVIRPFDVALALNVYLRAGAHARVVAALAELGQVEKILPYCQKVGYTPDFVVLLNNLVRINPDKGAEFATQIAQQDSIPIDIGRIVDIFMSQNMVPQATAFLLDALKENKPEQGDLQTRLLEINLLNAPQVADAILGNNMFSHYDKHAVAQLCEKAGLMQRALEHYEDISDIKRVIVQTQLLNPERLINYFGRLDVDEALICLREMLRSNIRQNLQVVIQIATKYSDLLGSLALISLFEEFKTSEGLFYYLQSIVNLSDDPDVIFKYIQTACEIGQFKEVERIVRENPYYNPEKVKNYLKEAKLPDQLPLIILCDKYDFVHDLVLYLYKNQQFKFIEVYVQRVNPSKTPAVVGALLDVDCDESIIKALLDSVLGQVPIEALVSEVESRNRLKLLLPFLEKTLESGSQETALYNALAKIYIDSNNNPEKFLKENMNYDTLTVGKYCEKRDPYLAFIAYQKGQNDLELVHITNENSMFKHQARYLLARAEPELWAAVLTEDNIYRQQLLDQVISTAVPESANPEDVSIVVKALMAADLPVELIELLEKIILEPSPFNDNENLQNLLILTAIKADKSKVMNLIQKLNEYDAYDIAQIAIDNELYEEAFEIYKKQKDYVKAVTVLVDNILSLDRASDFAESVDEPGVWSRLAKAQLEGLRINDAIDSYIRANDPSDYHDVIEIASHAGKDEELIKFLVMARKSLREPEVDGALILAYAHTNNLPQIENILEGANTADVDAVGDKLFQEEHYAAAKLLYNSISNWAKLASTNVYLGNYSEAVDCARKASNIKVWKEVNSVCVDKKEFRLAQICGLHLIVDAEELQSLLRQYESLGYFDESISLLEQGLGLERAHMGMFTELAILYAKYQPERMMEHLKLFWSRINIPKVLRACEQAHLWPELVFLYCHYDEWDNASLVTMERAADAFEHNSFKEMIVKVANLEIYYKAVNFYLEQHPTLLIDLLTVLTPRIDGARVVKMFERSDNIPLIKPFLISILEQNNRVVNEAYCSLLIEEKDYKSLRVTVDSYDNIDTLALAKKLEKHDLIFFRQIAAHLYKKAKKWNQSISLSKEDKLFKDAIDTAAASGNSDVIEELLQYFVDTGNHECYAAILYTCYDYIKPDLIQELNWRHGLQDFTMPYLINLTKETSVRLESLEKENETLKSKIRGGASVDEDGPIIGPGSHLLLTQGTGAGYANGMASQGTGVPWPSS
ncbi:hypothetical protein CANCADRAFT_32710 [Tortispora caseinolytica NRRL Y-17796]|uniref:Clathrin heavy chain n=1 Tax=Tortispora caseinolytica NRRL Y-17796 TaxID=767744 RepID=A0A1E4TCI7_9ASCO|nr:hypothetical protein CANCADRAFT_32710 [Tortispora caseinolytica NRRL Y-17796]